jgi:hypothetical protein
MSGDPRPLDIQVMVQDSQGTPRNDVTVDVLASNGTQAWSGRLGATGSNGIYRICDTGSFFGGATNIVINATASKPGFLNGTATGIATLGNLPGCP